MKAKIPQPLKLEHEELHAELVQATKAGGETAEAAKFVAKVLHAHFVKEEEFALPPIGLLSLLARGKVDKEMRSVLAMTERLKAELTDMLQEHKVVVAALKKLIVAAKREKKPRSQAYLEGSRAICAWPTLYLRRRNGGKFLPASSDAAC